MTTKKQEEPKDEEDIFNEENIPESNYFKFESVGDSISGELLSTEDRPPKDPFKATRVFELKIKDGSIWNVSIPLDKTYVISRAARAELGDTLGFKFEKEIPPATKGFHPAKSIQVYLKKRPLSTDEAFDQM